MLWSQVLNSWKIGIIPDIPDEMNGPYLWKTSVLSNDVDMKFKDEFIANNNLDVDQNYTSFSKYFLSSKNPDVCSFYNKSGDAYLIVPMPRKGKNFSNLKNFIDNADHNQQEAFWKEVAYHAVREKEIHGRVWVNTHGFGVPYLHVRIDQVPKYYGNSKLK